MALKRLFRSDQGSTLVELSLLLPVVLLIILSATELGMYVQRSMLVIEAASVGARFGVIPGNASNTAGMTLASQTAAEGLSGFTVAASSFCACSPGGAQISCTSSCGSTASAPHYVQVTTSANVPGVFLVSGLPKSMQPSATTTMRASWFGQ
jgi:Flp pilus assembly protein TadG